MRLNNIFVCGIFSLVVFGILPGGAPANIVAQESIWQKLDDGLQFAEFRQTGTASGEEAKITVVRIDPARYRFKLLSTSEHGGPARNLEQWAGQFGLVAAINAGMFQEDLQTSVGFMKNFEHTNNPGLNANKSIFAFNPVDSTDRPVGLIDRTCEDFERWRERYQSFLQSIRMVSCRQENVWQQQSKRWSIACLATDRAGQVLFIYAPARYSVHDLINTLLKMPLNIDKALYLEGGSTAGLYLRSGQIKRHLYGDTDSNFLLQNGLQTPQPIPNVLGVVKRAVTVNSKERK